MTSVGVASKRIGFVLVTLGFASSLFACSLLKKKGATGEPDAEPSAEIADASTVVVSGTGAKNEADVLRYANETPLANEPAVIGQDATTVRNFPGNGPTVAVLPKGTVVAKIAQYFSTGTLIMFDDPSGDGSKLIGWVPPKAFDVAAPPPAKPVVVPPRIVDAGTGTKDAGSTVAVKDAGAAHPVDAGGGGGGLAQPAKGTIAVPPVNGKCPDNWQLTEGMCRRKCAADAECPRTTKCLSKSGTKVCTSG